jgi:EAL domain-containing protein (putative c-di-GMP-specific phosphodiesterase class I)
MGCHFALDDFGSGLASFFYLKVLPLDYVKIDGVFVKDLLSNAFDLALVRSICDVARAGGMRTIAEFAENDAIIDLLREIGVDYAQGYGISQPRSLDEF